MTFAEYQKFTGETAFYKEHQGFEYTAIALSGEVGEYCNKVKKMMRDVDDPPTSEALAQELGDILWYLTRAAVENGYTLEQVAELNVAKLKSRQQRNVLSGSGDNR